MRLQNKVALITGGTSGIGQRTVEMFRQHGADVVFTGRRADLGEAVAEATGATFVEADAGSSEDAERAVGQTLQTHGRIDILMNNAGGPAAAGRIENLPLEGFDETIRVHVRGSLAHIKYAAPAMRAQSSGSIINIGSVAGHRAGYSSSLIYAVAKAALIHLTRCAAMELGERGIRVNAICPTSVNTPMANTPDGQPQLRMERKAVPLGRIAEPEEIAAMIHFLAATDCNFVNGQAIAVDGHTENPDPKP